MFHRLKVLSWSCLLDIFISHLMEDVSGGRGAWEGISKLCCRRLTVCVISHPLGSMVVVHIGHTWPLTLLSRSLVVVSHETSCGTDPYLYLNLGSCDEAHH